jgi:hypothetical protein
VVGAYPVLRDRTAEPVRRTAWLRDQYLHPEEHRHTLGEVQRWFHDQQVDYLRTYPAALVGQRDGDNDGDDAESLFRAAEDNWMRALGSEGGLFVVIGRRQENGAHCGAPIRRP